MSKQLTRAPIKAKLRNKDIKVTLRPILSSVPEDDLLTFPLYDLRKCGGVGPSLNVNENIIAVLRKLIDHSIMLKANAVGRDKTSQQYRINSFIKGCDAIKDYTKPITSGEQAQRDIAGVGKGLATRINEILKTGTLAELNDAMSDESRIIMELTQITGIGEVKAKSLINDFDITGVQDLVDKYKSGVIKIGRNQLTHHVSIGLLYYDDLRLRMLWSEADQIAKSLVTAIHDFDPGLNVEVCGSYRRQKQTCGDLDVLVSDPRAADGDPSPLIKIIDRLEKVKILVDHLTTKGKTKYMGVCKGPSGIGRRIDIRYVDHSSLGAAMLYFTGSGKFNKLMRYHANTRGYTLNEYGLYTYVNSIKGEHPIHATTEENIFSILGFVYLKPTEREF